MASAERNQEPASSGARIEELLVEGVRAGIWPGGSYAAGDAFGDGQLSGAAGRLAVEPAAEPASPDGLYDLASLTKGLFTAVVVARLAHRGLIDLDAPLEELLPEMKGYAGRTPSFSALLEHGSGLPAWSPLYLIADDPGEVTERIAALPPHADAPAPAVYSCLGPILAGIALERSTGLGLRELLEKELLDPLGLGGDELCWSPLSTSLRARCAPTERGRQFERGLCGEAWRPSAAVVAPGSNEMIRGEVHDGNAFFLGGAAGNAGLFATARAVLRVALALAFDDEFLPARLRRRFATGSADASRSLGFETSASPSAPGHGVGADGFGHTGFTGTLVWVFPERAQAAVLLTNRVHPLRREVPLTEWRRRFLRLALERAEA